MGDMKLIGAGALWVGPSGILSILLWSSLTGLLHFLAKRVMGAELSAGSQIAFGPHLALGIWLVWLFGPVML
jgi:leader peptidase (prepilin peptidase)/N-methyltransferase